MRVGPCKSLNLCLCWQNSPKPCSTVQTRIDRARTVLNFNFWWKYYLKFLGQPTSCYNSYYLRARSIQGLVRVYIESIRYTKSSKSHNEAYLRLTAMFIKFYFDGVFSNLGFLDKTPSKENLITSHRRINVVKSFKARA